MNSTPEYQVRLGSIARTILYEDSQGAIRFTFEWETIKDQTTIFLEWPSKSLIETEQLRINLAFERIKKYLIARGYKVESSE
ncbi:MAG: hypothetical protein M3Y82_04480 [Verrucomicrobiota bacterium]|nr:hypothetical protein [Verrucomicrobiota bacterium]